jgi:photosystem II stability/assembly factor-like uncharacterized protein
MLMQFCRLKSNNDPLLITIQNPFNEPNYSIMKKTYFLLMPCLFLMALTRVIPQNVTKGGSGNLKSSPSAGWQLISSGVEENLLSVHFANRTNGFIGGALSRCLKSTNGGVNWSPVKVRSNADFNAVWATSSNDAYLGGWDSVYATHNGGQSWTGAYTQTINYAINDLQYISPEKGFAFMTWAQFGKTTDSGDTWSLAPGGGFTAWDFFGGFMLNQNTGYAVGDNQVLCKTTDGGEHFAIYEWNDYSDFTGIRIWAVHATSELNAWAVADSGVVFRTTNGGTTWSRSTIAGEEDNLMDIYFVNPNTGYIVGFNGKIFKTSDGGNTWLPEPQLTNNNLNAVFFISENLGWAVGDNGTILRFWIDDTGISDSPGAMVQDVTISPNPALEQTSVTFILQKKMNLQIEIKDSSGRAVKNIFNGTLSQGKHTINMDLPDLSNGVYLCHLSAEGESICKPFVITK